MLFDNYEEKNSVLFFCSGGNVLLYGRIIDLQGTFLRKTQRKVKEKT